MALQRKTKFSTKVTQKACFEIGQNIFVEKFLKIKMKLLKMGTKKTIIKVDFLKVFKT